MWTGEAYNKKRTPEQRAVIDLSDAALRAGVLGGDKIWRNKVTIFDAEAGGCDLFDIDELRDENSPDEFANLYECEFIDDSLSVFSFAELKRAMIDADVEWSDYRRYSERPFANMPVWVGQDASLGGDNSSIAVVAPPAAPGGKFRLLELLSMRGANYETQAETLRRMTQKYNVQYMALDVTGGHGSAVHELVVKFYPRAKGFTYDVDFKSRMVLKAQSIFHKSRFEMDASETDLVRAFLSIRKTLTHSQKNLTFEASRNNQTGHADAAWAVMHTLINEPLDEKTVGRKRSFMGIY
nr:terminase family protein [Saezia sanguinis]